MLRKHKFFKKNYFFLVLNNSYMYIYTKLASIIKY